jgi:creatinine amidohydrolase
VNYFSLGVEAFNRVKETPVMAHADEFETSLYLHLAPDRVRMDRAVADNDVTGKYMSSDSIFPHVRFSDFWGRWTRLGVHGDPTAATAEKGKIIWEAVVSRLVEVVDELRGWAIPERSDQHAGPVQSHIQW